MADSFKKSPTYTIAGGAVTCFRSEKTGLTGVLVVTDEPLCSLHVAIATEADTNDWSHKDDGLPHTLEHAIFMGSELYPYKGILDKVANRSLADGTNAWTATDHTCYTLTTAGPEGCLTMLPIYADHILYPTLNDACFTTEIHHVTKEGEDKGVVYCEMQGRENNDSSLVDRAVLDLLYPTGGYSAETGGKMANLRALTNAQVTRYHVENYRPDNMAFIVSVIGRPRLSSAQTLLAASLERPDPPRAWMLSSSAQTLRTLGCPACSAHLLPTLRLRATLRCAGHGGRGRLRGRPRQGRGGRRGQGGAAAARAAVVRRRRADGRQRRGRAQGGRQWQGGVPRGRVPVGGRDDGHRGMVKVAVLARP